MPLGKIKPFSHPSSRAWAKGMIQKLDGQMYGSNFLNKLTPLLPTSAAFMPGGSEPSAMHWPSPSTSSRASGVNFVQASPQRAVLLDCDTRRSHGSLTPAYQDNDITCMLCTWYHNCTLRLTDCSFILCQYVQRVQISRLDIYKGR